MTFINTVLIINIMKKKFIALLTLLFILSAEGFSQDTTHTNSIKKQTSHGQYSTSKNSHLAPSKKYKDKAVAKKPIYRDTRLGSSSKQYNSYKKNDKGAGAITTNPHK